MREGNPTQGLLRARGEGGCAEFRCGVWRGAQARCLGAELRRGVWARSLAQNEAWSLARSFFGAEFGLSAEFWRGGSRGARSLVGEDEVAGPGCGGAEVEEEAPADAVRVGRVGVLDVLAAGELGGGGMGGGGLRSASLTAGGRK